MKLREYKEEYGLFTNICLNVTNACNLQCRYCFVNQKPDYMDLDTAKAAVDFVYNNLKRKRELTKNSQLIGSINFFGGEPMLVWDEICVPVASYVREKYPNDFHLGITTNGTLLSEKRIDEMRELGITPLLSMDGDRETQEYNRPCKTCSSFDAVERNIPYLLENFPNTTFRMTIYEDTCDKLFDNILYAEKMGFKKFFMTPDTRHNFSDESLQILEQELKKWYTYFTISIMNGIKPIENKTVKEMFLNALKEPSLEIKEIEKLYPREIFRCGLGTTSASVGPNGDIYSCQEQVTNDGEENLFYMGNIREGINKERHTNLLNEYRVLSPVYCEEQGWCGECSFNKICNKICCPSMSKVRFNNFFILPKTICFWNQVLFNLTKDVLTIENENILQYLTELIEKEGKHELYC